MIDISSATLYSNFTDTFVNSSVTWGQNFTVRVNFTVSTDGVIYTPIEPPATVTYYVKTLGNTLLLSGSMDEKGNGIYEKTLSSIALIRFRK